jgi:hypothetical protein
MPGNVHHTQERKTMPLRKGASLPAGSPVRDVDDEISRLAPENSNIQHKTSEEPQAQQCQHKQTGYPIRPRGSSCTATDIDKGKKSYAEHEKDALAARLSDQEQENLRTNSCNCRSMHDLEALREDWGKLDQEVERLEVQREAWAHEKQNFQAQVNKVEAEKIDLKGKVAMLERSRQSEYDALKLNYGRRYARLSDEKATLDKNVTTLSLEKTRLNEAASLLQREKSNLEARLYRYQSEQKTLRDDKNFFQAKWAEFSSATTKWATTNNSLSQMVAELQRENAQQEEEKLHLVEQCSDLVKEISRLRLQHLVDDDSALQGKFHSLHFAIRSWCCAIHDAKAPEQSAVFRRFPLSAPESTCELYHLADEEVNVLIACTWEWMVKLIFGSSNVETGYNDSPDLWTDEETALYLHNLELRLQAQGKVILG